MKFPLNSTRTKDYENFYSLNIHYWTAETFNEPAQIEEVQKGTLIPSNGGPLQGEE